MPLREQYTTEFFVGWQVLLKSDPSRAIREKWYKNKGFARATVISALNERVPPIGSVETAAVAGMKGDYLP